jgi:alginate O-acetyltransferase complex protein AlgI
MAADPDGEHRQSRVGTMASILMMFHLTCLGWLLFRATSVVQAIDLLSAIMSGLGSGHQTVILLTQLFGYLAILLVVQCIQWVKGDLLVLDRTPIAVRGVAYGVLFYLTVLHGGTSNSFIYFQF